MPNITNNLVQRALAIRDMLQHAPDIRFDLAQAEVATILSLIFCMMWKGLNDLQSIHSFLSSRGCKLDEATISFLLSAYDGEDYDCYLWKSAKLGEYVPHVGAMQPRD